MQSSSKCYGVIPSQNSLRLSQISLWNFRTCGGWGSGVKSAQDMWLIPASWRTSRFDMWGLAATFASTYGVWSGSSTERGLPLFYLSVTLAVAESFHYLWHCFLVSFFGCGSGALPKSLYGLNLLHIRRAIQLLLVRWTYTPFVQAIYGQICKKNTLRSWNLVTVGTACLCSRQLPLPADAQVNSDLVHRTRSQEGTKISEKEVATFRQEVYIPVNSHHR